MAIGGDAARRLVLTWTPWYRALIVAKLRPERIDLAGDVDHVELGHWDPGLHLPPGGWVTAWAGTSVPKLLRARLVFTNASDLRWPDNIVATARDPWRF